MPSQRRRRSSGSRELFEPQPNRRLMSTAQSGFEWVFDLPGAQQKLLNMLGHTFTSATAVSQFQQLVGAHHMRVTGYPVLDCTIKTPHNGSGWRTEWFKTILHIWVTNNEISGQADGFTQMLNFLGNQYLEQNLQTDTLESMLATNTVFFNNRESGDEIQLHRINRHNYALFPIGQLTTYWDGSQVHSPLTDAPANVVQVAAVKDDSIVLNQPLWFDFVCRNLTALYNLGFTFSVGTYFTGTVAGALAGRTNMDDIHTITKRAIEGFNASLSTVAQLRAFQLSRLPDSAKILVKLSKPNGDLESVIQIYDSPQYVPPTLPDTADFDYPWEFSQIHSDQRLRTNILPQILGDDVDEFATLLSRTRSTASGFRVLESLLTVPHSSDEWKVHPLHVWTVRRDAYTEISDWLLSKGFVKVDTWRTIDRLLAERVSGFSKDGQEVRVSLAEDSDVLEMMPIDQLTVSWNGSRDVVAYETAALSKKLSFRTALTEMSVNWSWWYQDVTHVMEQLLELGFTVEDHGRALLISFRSTLSESDNKDTVKQRGDAMIDAINRTHLHVEAKWVLDDTAIQLANPDDERQVYGTLQFWDSRVDRVATIEEDIGAEEEDNYEDEEYDDPEPEDDGGVDDDELPDETDMNNWNLNQLNQVSRFGLRDTPEPSSMRDVDTVFPPETIGHTSCKDQWTAENEYLDNWLADDDNVVLLSPPVQGTRWGLDAFCYSRGLIVRLMDDPSAVFIKCDPEARTDATKWAVKLPMGEGFQAYVPLRDCEYVVSARHVKVFQVRPTMERWDFTESRTAAARVSYVSANHCQDGTHISISRLRGVVSRKAGKNRRASVHPANGVGFDESTAQA